MTNRWKNMLLVAGSGRNVGKTTFICDLLEQTQKQQPLAVKISPHFHTPTSGLKTLSEDPHYLLFEETNNKTEKDSSLYLKHGASRSFYLQVYDEHLAEAFLALLPFLDAKHPILIESAALHKHIQSGFLLFIYNEETEKKPATAANMRIADFVIKSDGNSFNKPSSSIKFENEWKIIK